MKEKLSFHQHRHLLVEETLQTCLHTMKVVTAMNGRDSDDDNNNGNDNNNNNSSDNVFRDHDDDQQQQEEDEQQQQQHQDDNVEQIRDLLRRVRDQTDEMIASIQQQHCRPKRRHCDSQNLSHDPHAPSHSSLLSPSSSSSSILRKSQLSEATRKEMGLFETEGSEINVDLDMNMNIDMDVDVDGPLTMTSTEPLEEETKTQMKAEVETKMQIDDERKLLLSSSDRTLVTHNHNDNNINSNNDIVPFTDSTTITHTHTNNTHGNDEELGRGLLPSPPPLALSDNNNDNNSVQDDSNCNSNSNISITHTPKRKPYSFPYLKDVSRKKIPIFPGGMNLRNFPHLRFRKTSKLNSIHPGLTGNINNNTTRRGSEEFVTRRTLSQPTQMIVEDPTIYNTAQMARNAFELIDVNRDGFLQKEEVIAAIEKMKENGGIEDKVNSSDLADTMMREVDVDGDGQIDIDEFQDMMKRSSAAKLSSNGGNGDGNTFSSVMLSHNHRMSELAHVLLLHQRKIENSIIGHDLWMIHPLGDFHTVWDIFVSVLIMITVVTIPLTLGWEEFNEAMYAVNLTVDVIFLVDVGKNFCTGFVDENDAIIMDAATVRWNYLTGYFITDLCSSLPLDLILRWSNVVAGGEKGDNFSNSNSVTSSTKHSLRMLKLVRITKLFRLLRISRLIKQIKSVTIKIEEIFRVRITDGFTKLLRLALAAVILGHWIGCFNFMLVRYHDFPEDSWIVFADLHDKDPVTQWTWSFFKALAQMIMIGFETPPFTNASCDTTSHWCGIEHWVTLGCLYLGAVFYSLLISSISSILLNANLASRQFEEKLVQIDDYMRSKRLPATLREKVKDHFYLQHADGKLFNEEEILNTVTPMLRREIKHFNGRDVAAKVPLLSPLSSSSSNPDNRFFSEEISNVIEPTIAFPDETILRENTTGEEMFFISSGVVEIYLANATNHTAYVAIGDGCFFGEVSLLLGIHRTASARTKTQCLLFKASKLQLLKVLRDFPRVLRVLKQVARSRRNRLRHYVDPERHPLHPDDVVDTEDCKTELFGVDADKVVHEKEEEFERMRAAASHNNTNNKSKIHHYNHQHHSNAARRRSIGGGAGSMVVTKSIS